MFNVIPRKLGKLKRHKIAYIGSLRTDQALVYVCILYAFKIVINVEMKSEQFSRSYVCF